jgi:hypothetical protein
MTDLERLNAQNSALTREKQSLEREKMAIQKELKKSNGKRSAIIRRYNTAIKGKELHTVIVGGKCEAQR